MALRTLCLSTSSPVIFFLSRDYFLEAGSHKDDCGNAINVSTPRNLSAGLGSQFGGAGDGAGENLDLRGTCTEAGQVPSQQAVGLLVSGVKVDPERPWHLTHPCLLQKRSSFPLLCPGSAAL